MEKEEVIENQKFVNITKDSTNLSIIQKILPEFIKEENNLLELDKTIKNIQNDISNKTKLNVEHVISRMKNSAALSNTDMETKILETIRKTYIGKTYISNELNTYISNNKNRFIKNTKQGVNCGEYLKNLPNITRDEIDIITSIILRAITIYGDRYVIQLIEAGKSYIFDRIRNPKTKISNLAHNIKMTIKKSKLPKDVKDFIEQEDEKYTKGFPEREDEIHPNPISAIVSLISNTRIGNNY